MFIFSARTIETMQQEALARRLNIEDGNSVKTPSAPSAPSTPSLEYNAKRLAIDDAAQILYLSMGQHVSDF